MVQYGGLGFKVMGGKGVAHKLSFALKVKSFVKHQHNTIGEGA